MIAFKFVYNSIKNVFAIHVLSKLEKKFGSEWKFHLVFIIYDSVDVSKSKTYVY